EKEAKEAFEWEKGGESVLPPHIYDALVKRVQKVDFFDYWDEMHDDDYGPTADSNTSMVYYDITEDGSKKAYHINVNNTKPLFNSVRYIKAVNQIE
ncbi:hypothetical protein LPJ76_006261, partial [Coemansia sp. RSA 638]